MNWDRINEIVNDPYDKFIIHAVFLVIFIFLALVFYVSHEYTISFGICCVFIGMNLLVCLKEYARWK